jgi:hypothetical protein
MRVSSKESAVSRPTRDNLLTAYCLLLTSTFGAATGAATSVCGHPESAPHRGVPGTQLYRNDHPATRCVSHNCATGHSTGRTIRHGSSGSEAGRRSREQRGLRLSGNLPRDHAARATLGRLIRPRRPGLRVCRDRDRDRTRGRSRNRDRVRDRIRVRVRVRARVRCPLSVSDGVATVLCSSGVPPAMMR